jgi:hypothetical protein
MPERDTRPLRPLPADTFAVRGGHGGTARAVMASYGEVRVTSGDASLLEVTLPLARRAALEAELSLYPFLRLEGAVERGDQVTLRVRVGD